MGICWYCHWGWPKPVADIFNEAKEALGGDEYPLFYAAAHIVWADENFSRNSVQWCIDHFDEYQNDYNNSVLGIVKHSLEQLLVLPDEIRDPEPEAYQEDDEHPEKYPPPEGMEMVRI